MECGAMSENNTVQISHTLSSSCDDPQNQKTTPESGEKHKNEKIYECDLCSSTFFRLPHLEDHMNRHNGNRLYQCKERSCLKAYFAWKHLRKHLIGRHKLGNVKKSSYVGKEDSETDGKRFKCDYVGCDAEFNRQWKLISHKCKHTGEKLHACTEHGCNKAYGSKGHLRRHFVKSHMPRQMITKEYLCSEVGCEKVYRTVESLRRHYKVHYNEDQSKGPPYKCTTCKREFATTYHLTGHKCAQFRCEKCNLEFMCKSPWKNHLKIHQTFTCDVPECGEVFQQQFLLKEHQNLKHKQSFLCSTCNKKFISKATLKDHQQTHLIKDEKIIFPCPYDECKRFYTRKFNLHQHIRSKHEDIKFHCPVPECEKRLVTKQKLQEHMKLHDSLYEPRPKKHIARRQRKDAGKPKRSMAVKLSGVEVPYAEEKRILQSEINGQMNITTSLSNDGCIGSSEASDEFSETEEENDFSEISDDLSDDSEESDNDYI